MFEQAPSGPMGTTMFEGGFEGHAGFEIAAGTVPGRAHALSGKPNQDALVVQRSAGALVVLVADGCGSAEKSEVGAWIGAHTLAAELVRANRFDLEERRFWEGAQTRTLALLRRTAVAMGGDLEEVVKGFFLFTVVGAVIAGDRACVFSLGDGLFAVNGEVSRLGPFPGNAPPYLGHALLDERLAAQRRFVVHRTLRAADVESILVATDGATEWAEVESRPLPGTQELVGPLDQLWREDRFFDHPDALRRKLTRMNRVHVRPEWDARRLEREPGLLEDDTTVAVVRARKHTSRWAA